ncbi:Conserved_hypothetical protein [Hexamita inflata]|uniref:Uncharacterized protein n=1 Tax=Hexamita inflata TaxID=28002 RepID=A0AA86NCC7_9EUKA|nr:Conserved hypothetical protein [Hexamita inflata]
MTYLSDTHYTTTAKDLKSSDINAQSQVTQNELEKYVQSTIASLMKKIQVEFDLTQERLFSTVDGHPFYILFEPRLGCNTNQDASIAKSVLPIFQSDFKLILSDLEVHLSQQIEPRMRDMIAKREQVIVQTMTMSQKKSANSIEEAEALRKQVDYLQAALIDQRKSKNDQVNSLKREINTLREQLFVRNRVGGVYKPDFFQTGKEDESNQMVSQKYLQDQIAEVQNLFVEERKQLEKKHAAQQQSLSQTILELQGGNNQLRKEIEQLTKLLTIKDQEIDEAKNNIQKQIDQAKESLQKEVNQLLMKLQNVNRENDEQLLARDNRIKDLELRLGQFNQLAHASQEELKRLRAEYEKQQLANQNLVLTNQQLSDLTKRDENLGQQVQLLQDEVMMYRRKMEQLEKQIEDLRQTKAFLESELQTMNRPVSTNNDPEMQSLMQQAQQEYQDMKSLLSKTIKSLFEIGFGSMSKFMTNSLGNQQPHEILKNDIGPLQSMQQKLFREEYDLITQWCAKYIGFVGSVKRNTIKTGQTTNFSEQQLNSLSRDIKSESQLERISQGARKESEIQNSNLTLNQNLKNDSKTDKSNRQSDADFNKADLKALFLQDQLKQDNIQPPKKPIKQIDSILNNNENNMNQLNQDQPMGMSQLKDSSQNQSNQNGDRVSSAQIKCPSCQQQGIITQVEIFGGDQHMASVKNSLTCQCGHQHVNPELCCPECDQKASVTNVRISARKSNSSHRLNSANGFKKAENEASGDDEVEYLYKDDGLGFQKVNADGQLVNSDNNIDSSGSKKLQSPQDEQFILDHKHDHTDSNGQGQAPFTYCCPYCKNTTDIRADMTQSAFMSISQLNGNNNGNDRHSDYPTYNNPRQLFKTNPRQTTTPATVGVFERLLNKQKEIEKKQQRKRDLFLQERRRTMERILRSLSLFVDTAPIENLTKSFFQVQGASQKLIGLKSAREMTPGSAKQVSYIQAVLNMTDRRPESAVTQKMPTSAKRVEMSKRPMSGNQNNVMQLLQQKK